MSSVRKADHDTGLLAALNSCMVTVRSLCLCLYLQLSRQLSALLSALFALYLLHSSPFGWPVSILSAAYCINSVGLRALPVH